MKQTWENEFWNAFDEHTPQAPRPVVVAIVETVEPLVINIGGLLYESARNEVLVSHHLRERAETVTISAPQPHGTIAGEITYPAQLEAGDKVACVKLEGGQQVLVLAKVVA